MKLSNFFKADDASLNAVHGWKIKDICKSNKTGKSSTGYGTLRSKLFFISDIGKFNYIFEETEHSSIPPLSDEV